ncbi:MAG: hypothetical protein HOM55_10100 [Proteobacteria bacterium]|jgi:hypothetical protein|nr:hypothetical protein [Pseudomonadota bacterium]
MKTNLNKMMPKSPVVLSSILLILLSTLLASNSAYGHHSHANLDFDDIRVNQGTVVKYLWRMPHVYIVINAPNLNGEMVDHTVEMLHPPGMLQRGWKDDSFKPGDQITWQGAADRNPKRYYSGINWAEKADGTRLDLTLKDDPNKASVDFSGLWSRDLRGEPGHYAPPVDWPYTELAQEAVDNFDGLDSPMLKCIFSGPPKSNLLPYPIRITRPTQDIVFFEYEGRGKPRTIYLNGTAPEPGERSILGHSVGAFDGDTLVVETDNFSADRWGIHTGIDSSEEKYLTERFSLIDDGFAIAIEMVVSDPVYLTEAVTIKHFLRKIEDRDLVTTPCNLESASMYIDVENE